MPRILVIAAVLLAACSRAGERAATSGDSASRAATDPAAAAATPAADRVFEIRTYVTHPGRLDALNARFRDHTVGLFAKHGMTSIGYWIPLDSARATNTLIYIISHASRAQADKNWEAFAQDPEWQRVAKESQVDGEILKSIESVYVAATDYSPIK
jgi:NIPSNAP